MSLSVLPMNGRDFPNNSLLIKPSVDDFRLVLDVRYAAFVFMSSIIAVSFGLHIDLQISVNDMVVAGGLTSKSCFLFVVNSPPTPCLTIVGSHWVSPITSSKLPNILRGYVN